MSQRGGERVLRRYSSSFIAFSLSAIASLGISELLKARPPGGVERWTRTNHAGRSVTLLEGPAFALAAVVGALGSGAGAAAAVAGLGAASFGALDDLVGDSTSRGLRGHLAAARHGDVTTGAVKVGGLCATGLMAACSVDRSHQKTSSTATLVGGAVIAASANMANLLDLRPGRALKAVLLFSVPIAARSPLNRVSAATAAAAAGASISALPDDLRGRSMLGDTGANSAGALLGTALVARSGMRGRLLALVVLTALTLASEKFSFTNVIESTPGLRELDAFGRPRR